MQNPLEFEIPFKKGTMEYASFWINVGEPLHMVTGLLAHGIESRPESLKEREKRVHDLHRTLVARAASTEKAQVPPEYRPAEWESLERAFDQIQKLRDAFWEEHRRGQKSVDQILEELTSGKS